MKRKGVAELGSRTWQSSYFCFSFLQTIPPHYTPPTGSIHQWAYFLMLRERAELRALCVPTACSQNCCSLSICCMMLWTCHAILTLSGVRSDCTDWGHSALQVFPHFRSSCKLWGSRPPAPLTFCLQIWGFLLPPRVLELARTTQNCQSAIFRMIYYR